MNDLATLLIPISGIAMVFGIVYLGVTSDNRRDLAMIEAGMNPKENKNDKMQTLKKALLLIFIPLGFFVGQYLRSYITWGNSNLTGIIFAFLFGGVALLLFYFISSRKSNHNITE